VSNSWSSSFWINTHLPIHDLNRAMSFKKCIVEIVRNRTVTLIEREDDTRSWEIFLIYFSHSTTISCPLRG
jgi:hypothetical protein